MAKKSLDFHIFEHLVSLPARVLVNQRWNRTYVTNILAKLDNLLSTFFILKYCSSCHWHTPRSPASYHGWLSNSASTIQLWKMKLVRKEQDKNHRSTRPTTMILPVGPCQAFNQPSEMNLAVSSHASSHSTTTTDSTTAAPSLKSVISPYLFGVVLSITSRPRRRMESMTLETGPKDTALIKSI